MQFPHVLFKTAGLNSTDVAALCGVSRITGYRWMRGVNRSTGQEGVGVNVFLRDRVAKVVKGVQQAIDAGMLPDAQVGKLPPKDRAARIKAIITQRSTKN